MFNCMPCGYMGMVLLFYFPCGYMEMVLLCYFPCGLFVMTRLPPWYVYVRTCSNFEKEIVCRRLINGGAKKFI